MAARFSPFGGSNQPYLLIRYISIIDIVLSYLLNDYFLYYYPNIVRHTQRYLILLLFSPRALGNGLWSVADLLSYSQQRRNGLSFPL
jgi:hypothetical protein